MRMIRRAAGSGAALFLVLYTGCMTMGRPAPAEEITEVMAAYHSAMQAQDIGGVMAAISDDFSNSQGGKSALHEYFQGAISLGVYMGVVVSFKRNSILVVGDAATISPVIYDLSMGRVSVSYKLEQEENGPWRIVNLELIP